MKSKYDLTDQKFGKLTVIKKSDKQSGRAIKWHCRCECGLEADVTQSNLRYGSVTSCGNHRIEDLTNQRFGKLIPLKLGKGYCNKNHIYPTWICQCDCGNIKEIKASLLKLGKTKSCGCYRSEVTRQRMFTGYKEIRGRYWWSVTNGAKKRKLKFEITKEQVWNLLEKQNFKCALSGVDIFFGEAKKQTASIDRINNSEGYILSNIQIVHKIVNIMKNNLLQSEFIDWCEKISRKIR